MIAFLSLSCRSYLFYGYKSFFWYTCCKFFFLQNGLLIHFLTCDHNERKFYCWWCPIYPFFSFIISPFYPLINLCLSQGHRLSFFFFFLETLYLYFTLRSVVYFKLLFMWNRAQGSFFFPIKIPIFSISYWEDFSFSIK